MILIFWTCLITLLFIYVGYPLCLVLIGYYTKKYQTDESFCPLISIIIPVYNEEKIIAQKIENSLLLEYPKGKLEIVVASDGSDDNTKRIVESYAGRGITFFEFQRAGKLATINRVVPKTSGEILVFTDANAMFVRDALRKMTRHFINDDVGVVTGIEKITASENYISKNEQSYWNYETRLKTLESEIYSTIGANGPIYAIRRELFPSIPSHLNLCDDMTISLSVIQRKKRIILEPEAIALENASLTLREEWYRKIRISTRAWQALLYHKKLLNPFISPVALPLIFHKVFRWLTLLFMVFLLIGNLFVSGSFYTYFLGVQIILHSISAIGIIFLWDGIKMPSVITFLSYFLFTNAAQVVGFYNSIFGKGKPHWQPIRRTE